MFKFNFLGDFGVLYNGQPIENFRYNRLRALLAYLAIETRDVHSREELAAMLWPHESDQVSRQNLRQSLYHLRQTLKHGPESEGILTTTRQCVRFNRSCPYWLDVEAFNHQLEQNQPEQAMELYRGNLLPHFFIDDSPVFEEWLVTTRERLHRRALDALHQLAFGSYQASAYDRAERFARHQLTLEPWQEAAHRQLMIALAAAGRKGAAIKQYEKCKKILAEILGIRPATETDELLMQIRAGAYDCLGNTDRPLVIADRSSHKTNLPCSLTPILGREKEINQINQLLVERRYRLITVAGMAGIGKTSVALEAGQKFFNNGGQNVAYVTLDPVKTKTSSLAQAIACGLNLDLNWQFEPENQVLDYLKENQLLLILDGIDACGEDTSFLITLLRHAPGVIVLAIGNSPLNYQAEKIIEVQGLDLPLVGELGTPTLLSQRASVQLFIERTNRLTSVRSLDAECLPIVAKICQWVGGHPLAIILAASRTREWSLTDIATIIQINPNFLVSDSGDLLPRHRNMETVLDVMWQTLTDSEIDLLTRIQPIGGRIDRATLESQADLLAFSDLVRKMLLRRATNDQFIVPNIFHTFVLRRANISWNQEPNQDPLRSPSEDSWTKLTDSDIL